MKKIPVFLMVLLPVIVFGQVQLRLPEVTVVAGTTVNIPVYVDTDLTGMNVFSYQLEVSFVNGRLNPIGICTDGTLSDNWAEPLFNAQPGKFTFVAAGATALQGSGVLVYLICETMNTQATHLSFTGDAFNFFNEGEPALVFVNGYVNKTSPDAISINPSSAVIVKGETLQFEVSGQGTPLYNWGVTNPGICSINSNGLLTATNFGFTKVFCTDAVGLTDTTNVIDIRAVQVNLPQSNGWPQQMVTLPVIISETTGLGIISGEIEYTFNQNILTPINIKVENSLLEHADIALFDVSAPGKIVVTFAHSEPISGQGILFGVDFQVANQTSGSTNLSFQKAMFNEDIPAKTVNGSFNINYSNIHFNPNTAHLIAGNQVAVTVSGGIPPYSWEVMNNEVAGIWNFGGGPEATLTALSSGATKIKVTDINGIEKLSGDFVVFDNELKIFSTSIPVGSNVLVPVMLTSQVAIENIYALEIEFLCHPVYLEFWGIVSENSLTADWELLSNSTGNKLTVAGAGANPVNTGGILFYLLMYAKPNLPIGTNAWINISTSLFNEGLPNAKTVNGTVTGAPAYPNISVDPISINETMPANNSVTKQITVSNSGIHNLIFNVDVQYTGDPDQIITLELPDSPPRYNYSYNTLAETGWHQFETEDTLIISSATISYNWFTDNWPFEGSFWIKNDETSGIQIASGETNGSYSHSIEALTGTSLNNNWEIWIEDTYGDGGHQASNVELTFNTTTDIPATGWLSFVCNEYVVEPETSYSFNITINSANMEPGNYFAEIVITSNDSNAPTTTIPIVLEVTEQDDPSIISLNAGWNLISFDVFPNPDAPIEIFSPENLTTTLEMVTGFQNQTGVFYDPNGLSFLNTLTQMFGGEGYWVKVETAGTLTVYGTPVPDDCQINLLAGWNLIGYWPDETTTPEAAFAPLINAGVLEMVTGYEQGGLFFDPFGLPFLNTLIEIKNGFGYWVKVSANYPGFIFL